MFRAKSFAIGLALAAAATGAISAAPAEARPGGGHFYGGGHGYYGGGFRGGYVGGWHGGGYGWRGYGPGYGYGYRAYPAYYGWHSPCWTEWRGGRWGGAVRICE